MNCFVAVFVDVFGAAPVELCVASLVRLASKVSRTILMPFPKLWQWTRKGSDRGRMSTPR